MELTPTLVHLSHIHLLALRCFLARRYYQRLHCQVITTVPSYSLFERTAHGIVLLTPAPRALGLKYRVCYGLVSSKSGFVPGLKS